jgi:hypothetical protein
MTYDFRTKLQEGLRAEEFLDRILSSNYRIKPASKSQQRQGIDRIITHVLTGQSWRVEYKTDQTAGNTGNAFVETISVDSRLKLGWAVTSESDLLFYYIPADGLIYVIPFEKLRTQLPRWLRSYPVRSIPNGGYSTHGILVPLHEFEALAQEVISC